MNPFLVKKAMETFVEFEKYLTEYWEIESKVRNRGQRKQHSPNDSERSDYLRQKLSWLLGDALFYEKSLRISTHITIIPPAVVGGPPVTDSAFNWSLRYGQIYVGHLPHKDAILDAIKIAISTTRILYGRSIRKAINPIFWLIYIFSWIVRIPFLILRQAGVSSKIEENIISQAIKVLSMIGLIYVFLKIPFFKDNGAIDVLISLIK